MTLVEWAEQLCDELQVPRDAVNIRSILELARDAAHGIERPAAPVSTFILGYAAALAAQRGLDSDQAVTVATRLIAQHAESAATPENAAHTESTPTAENAASTESAEEST